MKRTLMALTALFVFCTMAFSQAGEKGFVKLFNGKDLTGWRYPKRNSKPMDGKTQTPDGRIEVKDGAIVMKARDSKGQRGIRDLYTKKEFGSDFILKLQFKAGLKADSGVYIRGPQLQIRDFIRRGEQKQLKKFKNDDWNDLQIYVKGNKAFSTVNGEKLRTMKVPAKGPIGLQAESGKFEFRNIRIKVLN